jgi:hypothetical protein
VQAFSIDRPVAPVDLVPSGARIVRTSSNDTVVVALARAGCGSILITALPRTASVAVSAATDAEASQLATAVRQLVPAADEHGTVDVRTWYLSCHGNAVGVDRRIEAPAWSTIERNYPTAVRQALARLFSEDRPAGGGKLILWHGEPGTGKTTALRALMRAWEPWCAGQYIADPERLFADPAYINEVLTRSTAPRYGPTLTRAADPEALWRLIVAEDCDEYLRASARRDAGAGLGRLLNLADGLLGQGYNALMLLTTNEELHRLHPALVRPGRCLARVEFFRFPMHEARDWLPPGARLPDSPATLAELFEARGDVSRIGDVDDGNATTGQYL